MRLYYRFARLCCQLFYVLFCRGRAVGTRHVPATGGVLLIANHQSYLDPVICTLALPRECSYMAKAPLFTHRLFRRLIESLNAFPVKEETADVGAIKESLRRLRAGKALVIYPEGQRTFTGQIGSMFEGALLVARRAKVPVVPTLIEGAFEAWPRWQRLPRRGWLVVAYGRPIPPDEVAACSPPQLADRIREELHGLQQPARRIRAGCIHRSLHRPQVHGR